MPEIISSSCQNCGKEIDAASEMANIDSSLMPKPGDYSLCFYCGEWNIFDNHLRLRKPTDDELFQIGLSQECRNTRIAWVRFQKGKKKNA